MNNRYKKILSLNKIKILNLNKIFITIINYYRHLYKF